MKVQFLRRFDFIFIVNVTILSTFGVLFIYSAGLDNSRHSSEYMKQMVWIGAGFVAMTVAALYDYRRYKRFALYGYVLIMFALVFVRLFTRESHGANSWITIGGVKLQPSEFGKVIYIMYLAKFLEGSSNMQELKRFLHALGIMMIPVGLILSQPDLGTASVYVPIFLVMCFMGGIPVRYLMLVISIGMGTIIFSVLPVWHSYIWLRETGHNSLPFIVIFSEKKYMLIMVALTAFVALTSLAGYLMFKKRYYYWITYVFGILAVSLALAIPAGKVLHDYQIQRLIIFLNPDVDPQGRGWHIKQSLIAIGSGGVGGRGFKMGAQSHLGYLPEQTTDFIFSILAEEAGLVGGLVVFACFLTIFIRIIYIIKNATNRYGFFIACGILGMLFFHFMVNIGMVMGVMPITGIPLPFLSYGGSSCVTNMICLGLLMSINSRRLDFSAEVV